MKKLSINGQGLEYSGGRISVMWGTPFKKSSPIIKKSPITQFLMLVRKELERLDGRRYQRLGKDIYLRVVSVYSLEIRACLLVRRPNFKSRIAHLLNWDTTSYFNPVYDKAGQEVSFDDIYQAINLLQSAGEDKFVEFLETGILPGGISAQG